MTLFEEFKETMKKEIADNDRYDSIFKVCPEDKFNDLILKGHSSKCALKMAYHGHECIGEELKPISKAEAMKPSGGVGFEKWLKEKENPPPNDTFILIVGDEKTKLNSNMTINEIKKIVTQKLPPGHSLNISFGVSSNVDIDIPWSLEEKKDLKL